MLWRTTVEVHIDDRLGFRGKVWEARQWHVDAFDCHRATRRITHQRFAGHGGECHTPESQSLVAKELPPRLLNLIFDPGMHDQFLVTVSSRFKSVLAINVYAASSLGSTLSLARLSPRAINFLASSTSRW